MYDLDFRYRRALTPNDHLCQSQLAAAIEDAKSDAALAGISADADPAVALLTAQYSDRFHSTTTNTEFLAAACERKLSTLAPAIISIVRSGAAEHGRGIMDFRREARMTLRDIGRALGIECPDQHIHVRSQPTGPDEIVLRAGTLTVEILGYRWNADNAVAFSVPKSCPGQSGTAPIEALADLDDLVRIIQSMSGTANDQPKVVNA